MALRGSFGRKRGNVTNLTALIASLLREQRQAEDRAMFDAYQNGGLYKGKPVTDGRILGYIKGRRDSFSTDDPLYDEWNSRLIQTRFSIGEQKIGLAFKQGRVGAGAVASFYRGQLKSIPKDSAFYRTVAGRAADWAKSAAGAARGRARGRATAGMREKLNKQLEMQQTYLQLEAALTAYARREGVISGDMKLADADATDLQGMFDRGIYSGADRITFSDFRSAAKDHYTALGGEIETRRQLGNQTIEARNKRARFLDETLVRLNAVDDRAKYEMAREVLIEKINAAGNDPYASKSAYEAYAKTLEGIHAVATAPGGANQNDPQFIGGLKNEWKAIQTGEATGATVADIYGIDDELQQDGGIANDIAVLNDNLDQLDKDTAYFGQSEPGGPMGVVPWPPGAGKSALGLDDSLQLSISRVNGERRLTYLKGQAVTASAIIDVNTQSAVDRTTLTPEELRLGLANGAYDITTEGDNLGYVFTNPVNGTVKYGVRDPATGQMYFTEENPWSSEPTLDASGVLTVFSNALVSRRGSGDKPKFVPDTSALLVRPINANTADPLMSDSTVAPKDLLALVANGTLGAGFTEDQVAAYQARLQREQDRQDRARMFSDDGPTGRLGAGDPQRVVGGGGDASRGVLDAINGVQSLTPTIQSMFGATRDSRKETRFVPPPPPTPPKPPSVSDTGDPRLPVPKSLPDDFVYNDPTPDDTGFNNPPKPKPLSPYDPRNTPRSGVLE